MPRRPPTLKTSPPGATYARPSPTRRGYGHDWQRVRLTKLAADPMCQAHGCTAPATEVDHVRSLASGGTHDPANLMSLCKPCHSQKTNAADGGLGRHARTVGPNEARG